MLDMLLETVTIIGGEPVTDLTIAESLVYALLGFVVTFIGIIVLIFILWAIGKAMAAFREKKAARKQNEQDISEAVSAADEIPAEIKAAVVAAIAAYYAGEQSSCEFKVKRIKKL